MSNTTPNLTRKKGETITDYKIAIKLFKRNFRPFFVVLLIGTILFWLLDYIYYDIINIGSLINQPFPTNIAYVLIRIPPDAVFFGFLGVAMGLGFEIMSSGDEFTKIKNSFYYIRRYWLKYFLLSIILNWIVYILRFIDTSSMGIELGILIRIVSFCWFVAIAEAYPALLNRKRFIHALRDNFNLLRNNFSRIFKTFGIYYIIFLLPRTILHVIFLWYIIPYQPILIQTFVLIFRILNSIYIIFGFPIFAFLSIGIYNSELRFKDIPER